MCCISSSFMGHRGFTQPVITLFKSGLPSISMAYQKVVFISVLVFVLSSYSSQSVINSEFKTDLVSNTENTDVKSDGVYSNHETLNTDVLKDNKDNENEELSTDIPVDDQTIPEEADKAVFPDSDKSNFDDKNIPDENKLNNYEDALSDLDKSIAYSDSESQDEGHIDENPDSPQTTVKPEQPEFNSESEDEDQSEDNPSTVNPETESEEHENKPETEDTPEQTQGSPNLEENVDNKSPQSSLKLEGIVDTKSPQGIGKPEGMVDTSVRELDPVELTPEDEDMVIMKMRELGGILDEKEIADIIQQEQTLEDMEGDLPEETEDLKFEPIPMPTDFESYDRNGDGLIEMEELTDVTGAFENVADAFIVCDRNGDGFIDEEEFRDAPWDLSGKPPEVVQEQL